MLQVTINIGSDDVKTIKKIFENEADFQPQSVEDKLLIAIMRQVVDNPKTPIEDACQATS